MTCQGLNSPVFFQPSQPIHNILVSDYLKDFVEKGWHIQLNTVTVSNFDMNYTTDQTYILNGLRMILPPPITSDISVNTNTEAWFQSESLSVQVIFTGDATFQYQVSAHNSGAAFVQMTALCFLADKKSLVVYKTQQYKTFNEKASQKWAKTQGSGHIQK